MVVSLDRRAYGNLLSDPAGPDRAMDLLQEALQVQLEPRYPWIRFGPRKAHALPIELGATHPSFDLVPAFETVTDDDDVLIADRIDQRWERSNTREMIRVVAEANQEAGGKLIHVVRMVKHAVRGELHEKFPGLVVESFLMGVSGWPLSYAEASARAFENGYSTLGGPIFDPTGRDDLAPKIEQIEPGFTARARAWFRESAEASRRARSAAEAGDHNTSIAWWHRVFGSPFPLPPTEMPPEVAAPALTFSSASPRPTRAWRRLR